MKKLHHQILQNVTNNKIHNSNAFSPVYKGLNLYFLKTLTLVFVNNVR